MSGTFYIFKCKCNKWSVQETRTKTLQKATFKCKYCGKITKIKQKKTYALALPHKGPYPTPQEATTACQKANYNKKQIIGGT